jgi:hypothetical protein
MHLSLNYFAIDLIAGAFAEKRPHEARRRCFGVFFLWLFGSLPLQFFKVGDTPLQFTYSQAYHYNSRFV